MVRVTQDRSQWRPPVNKIMNHPSGTTDDGESPAHMRMLLHQVNQQSVVHNFTS
jgi:hypothetical protein